ncbi:MAG: hypothetical protein HY547_09205 [Elusimicrobia bacterium]|nr:hypothetical protein [Elusimicrobiota bacterium]
MKKSISAKRNTWIACPKCGHKVARVRICDMELKCKRCGHKFEAVIGVSKAMMVREGGAPYQAEPVKQKDG